MSRAPLGVFLWAMVVAGVAHADVAKEKRDCGCAPQRLLSSGSAVWLDDDETQARVVAVPLSYFDNKTSLEGGALPLEPLTLDERAAKSLHRLMRIDTTALSETDRVALLRDKEAFPKDVKTPHEASAGSLSVREMWLGPRGTRERKGCGPYETLPVLFSSEVGPGVDALIVEHDGQVEVIDARHARTFGLGRVQTCGHGMAFGKLSGPVSITAVHVATGDRAGPFVFDVTGTEVPVPKFETEGDNPFVHGLGDAPGLGHDEDEAALTAMMGVGGGAFAFAFFLWPMLRRRRRDERAVTCPVCEAETVLDMLDDKTDGMFCPKCGKSSVFVQVQADGARLPMVIALDEDEAEPRG